MSAPRVPERVAVLESHVSLKPWRIYSDGTDDSPITFGMDWRRHLADLHVKCGERGHFNEGRWVPGMGFIALIDWPPAPLPRAEGSAAPLWEWVRAAEESALGKPSLVLVEYDFKDGYRRVEYDLRGLVAVVQEHDCNGEDIVQTFAATCHTPAELRAALDKLAAEVKP